uniref:Uncharacterized protein n=1 Tax=Chenopodium quinoa TaxID=63459 RepID=A0A803NF03_CHEQI
MDAPLTQVVISFRPLLKQITECLDFPDPEYQYLNLRKSIACLDIRSKSSVVPTIYLGGDTDNMYERCGRLYGYKKEDLEAINKGKSKVYFHGDISTEIGHNQRKVVIDFLEVLRSILSCVDVKCTPIEIIEQFRNQYVSWFTIIHHRNSSGFRCLFSDYCLSQAAAKQDLARKVVDYLIDVCNLEIVDANYRATTCRFDALLCVLERESYLSVKERVLGVKEKLEPSSGLVEQDCVVPVGGEFQVPISNPPVIAFSKIELKSQVPESFAIYDSSIEEIPKGEDSDHLHGRFKRAVYDLIKRYDIVVEDVTVLHKQMYERCGRLYGYKKEDLEAINKGKSKVYFHGDISTEIGHNQRKVVIDFLEVLRSILSCVDVKCTPIEIIEQFRNQYVSWFTIIHHRNSSGFRCLFSDYCLSQAAAKQDLARKVVDYLIDVCNLEIVDANYRATTCRFDALLCVLERESYLSVKERVLGVKEKLEPSSGLVEQDCVVPVGGEFQVPISNPPVIAFSKIELKSQVPESFAIYDSSIEEIQKGEDSDHLHGRFKRVRLLKD